MPEQHSTPVGPVGNLFHLAAAIASGTLGFLEKPAIQSIAIGAVLFVAGYALVRLPQILGLFRADGPKAFLVFLYLLIPYTLLSAILYFIGRLFS